MRGINVIIIIIIIKTVKQRLLPSGATTAEKLRGTKVWVPTLGRLRPEAGLGVGCGRGSSPPAVRVRVSSPENF